MLPAAAVVSHGLLPWQRTGQASLPCESAAWESQGEVAMHTTISDFFFFCGQGQQLVQWPPSQLLCFGSVAGTGGKEEVELPFILLGKCFLAVGSCQNYNMDSDALASKTSDGGMPSISMNFLWFWSETTGRWGFVVLLMAYVPKGVCRTLLTVTYFL